MSFFAESVISSGYRRAKPHYGHGKMSNKKIIKGGHWIRYLWWEYVLRKSAWFRFRNPWQRITSLIWMQHTLKQLWLSFLPLANEVCEGYVFTHVCHSVHRSGSPCPHQWGRLRGLAGGVFRPTPRGEVEGSGWKVYPSMHWGRTPLVDGYRCGWYASYWNAFLFFDEFTF